MTARSTNFEIAARVPLIVRAPAKPRSLGGQVVRGFAELVDLFPTLAELAGTPAPIDSLDGSSLVPFFDDPSRLHFPTAGGTQNKSLAFTQYPHSSESFGRQTGGLRSCVFFWGGRCHSHRLNSSGGGSSSSGGATTVPPPPSNWMGYSVRTHDHRYTVWLPAGAEGNDSHVNWDATRANSFEVDGRYEELYTYPHTVDGSIDFNELDIVNLAYDVTMASTVARLYKIARGFFDTAVPPPPPPPPSGGLKLPPHPRLRMGAADELRIRGLTGPAGDTRAQSLLRNITDHALFVLSQPVPPGNDLLCDAILDHMYTLGMVYRLSTNATLRHLLAQRAAVELLRVSALASWDPKRFLTVAETMHGVSIGYDWFYHALTAEQRQQIEDGLYRAGLGVGLQCWRYNCSWTPGIPDTGNCSGCWWIRADMNWNLVSNGGIAIAALALGDVPRYAAAARQALSLSAEGYPYALRGYENDGAWPEGPHYWSYATKYVVATIECLLSATGSDYGHMQAPGLNVTAYFALQTYATPSGSLFNYGDTNEISGSGGMDGMRTSANLLSLARLFPALGASPSFFARTLLHTPRANTTGGFDEAVVALLRWSTNGSQGDLAALPHQAFYPQKQVAVARSGWSPGDSYLGVKGGNSAMTHQDLDHGSFVFDRSGQRWVCDLGIENYLLAGMFGSSTEYSRTNFSLDRQWGSRYAYYRKATRGHNTLTFDERGGFDPVDAAASDQAINIISPLILPRSSASAWRDGLYDASSRHFVAVNLTEAYSRQLSAASGSVIRSFALDDAMSCLTITDEIRGIGAAVENVSFTIHTRAHVTLGSSGPTLRSGGHTLRVRTRSTATAISGVQPLSCGAWRADEVRLPTDQQPAAARFPVRGAAKVWVTCGVMPPPTAAPPLASGATSFVLTTSLCEV